MNVYRFHVDMPCQGCSSAVQRVLSKLEGVADIKIDLPSQIVEVMTNLECMSILKAIEKTGKTVNVV